MLRVIVAVVGVVSSILAGILSAPNIGAENAAIFTGLLLYVFALAFGGTLALTIIMKPPFPRWKLFMPAILTSLPMFLGWFPVSNWLFKLGFTYGFGNTPSSVWILGMMILGLFGDGSILTAKRRTESTPSTTA